MGIIPAYAGNTRISKDEACRSGDHPRLRGEHGSPRLTTHLQLGSSPPTRGTLTVADDEADDEGIIPAYAGNTTVRVRAEPVKEDHPRLRGEHNGVYSSNTPPAGSSPPTRGTQLRKVKVYEASGIIPAYAGNTSVSASARGRTRDHPRLRGEHHFCPPHQTFW